MITFKQFLKEGIVKPWSVTKPDPVKALEIIKTNCSDAFEHYQRTGAVLYRGFGKLSPTMAAADFALIDATGSHRTSRDASNLYMLVMDTIEDLPNRSRSLICSSNASSAQSYGTVYAVFPFNSQPIAKANKMDFFENMVSANPFCTAVNIGQLDNRLVDIFERLELSSYGSYDDYFTSLTTVNAFLKDFHWVSVFLAFLCTKHMDDVTDAIAKNWPHTDLAALKKQEAESLAEIIEGAKLKSDEKSLLAAAKSAEPFTALAKIIAPKIKGVKIVNIDSIVKGQAVECWFEGKAMVVSLDVLSELTE